MIPIQQIFEKFEIETWKSDAEILAGRIDSIVNLYFTWALSFLAPPSDVSLTFKSEHEFFNIVCVDHDDKLELRFCTDGEMIRFLVNTNRADIVALIPYCFTIPIPFVKIYYEGEPLPLAHPLCNFWQPVYDNPHFFRQKVDVRGGLSRKMSVLKIINLLGNMYRYPPHIVAGASEICMYYALGGIRMILIKRHFILCCNHFHRHYKRMYVIGTLIIRILKRRLIGVI
jgi:hypothetical protein